MVEEKSPSRHPQKTTILALGLAAILILSICAYFLLATPRRKTKASMTSWPLEFSIELNRTDFLASENVSVRIAAKNLSNESVSLGWREARFWYDPPQTAYFDCQIFSTNGAEVFNWRRGLLAAEVIVGRTLESGEQLVNIFNWTQTTGYPDFVAVPKGIYFVRASISDAGLSFNGHSITLALQTPNLIITIE